MNKDIPTLSEIYEEIHKEFEIKNKPTYEFLYKNEDLQFIEKLIEFADEVSDLSSLKEHHQEIIDDIDFDWRSGDEDFPHPEVIEFSFKQTVNGGDAGDFYAGYTYVRLPKSGKVFKFEYSI